ncbi:MAG: bifunctional tRNA (5-methylaminomethyl-2-thiouridine)(34)-methyltransferase MnmD/FAD-dependent 5-carboxymethylaminomethyl-2-thiouridine(34) oxidoreductase MnmC [Alcanivoracaceae bacterium]|nr:bifunctional tRNA (5-methylaminomethyl-2-thiouridine)(34)-methyltransferase MnmD/FAD-dependent 5-carboxymethylaminomethyl-2-thiouridine(34) oxidoreductase MnmC [Alcanivoracaceae bacterium]
MPSEIFAPIEHAELDWHNDEPGSVQFADNYFSRDNGLAETRHVFIDGNQLVQRFAALQPGELFVIGETGFGTGLNFLVAVITFLEHAPLDARLHFISTEKFPLRPQDLARALQRWPQLGAPAEQLLEHYPPATPGFHRRSFCNARVQLTLAFGDVLDMLAQCDAHVDAWFLDGFAPARNEAMWRQPVFDEIARLSGTQTTLATFTSAGFVRRGLQQAGFTMQRVPGFGRKREMLSGRARSAQPRPATHRARHIAVIGAGLAGCTSAAALAARGHMVSLFDPLGIANAASGNLAGVVYTTPSAHMTAQNRFYQGSYLYALDTFSRYGFPASAADGALNGVLQYAKDARQAEKQQQALDSGYWPASLATHPDDAPAGALLLPRGGYLSPGNWCRHLLQRHGLTVTLQQVTKLVHHKTGWQLSFADNTCSDAFDEIVLANADAALQLVNLPWLKLKRIRGQVSQVAATPLSRDWQQAICHAGYLTPAINDQHCVGATFDLHDDSDSPRAEDDQRNLVQLHDNLPGHWQRLGGAQAQVLTQRVGFRCQSTDFLPLCGPLVECNDDMAGVWLTIAHGSRGITGTALCAELLASELSGEPLPVDRKMREALAPVRFLKRLQRRVGK